MGTIKIAPHNRLEGHLDIEATTTGLNSGQVTNADNMVVMFRGIELIMVDRDPRDAPIITQRV